MIAKIFWYFLTCSIYINVKGSYDCDSKIFCQGKILETIQLSNPPIYKHSADFVEMKLKNPPQTILAKFEKIEKAVKYDVSLLKLFADENFEPDIPERCSDLENQQMPEFEAEVANKAYKLFVTSITNMWPKLVVQTKHVEAAPEFHSLVYLPNCQVKSDEFTATTNYSDNYWVFRGLMASGMTKTAAGIIENYTYLIKKHGFVLHSNRVYSSRRTQLPLLALMMENYFNKTKNEGFLLNNLEALESEFLWWTKNRYFKRTIKKKMYDVFQYYQEGDRPRSEAFREDHEVVQIVRGLDKYIKFFSSIRAVDETGLGHCTRFKRSPGRTLASVSVRDLVPVELNSVLHRYAVLLGQWFRNLKKDIAAANKYEEFAKNIANVIKALWSRKKLMWLDWDVGQRRARSDFSPTNLMPLFTMSYPEDKAEKYSNYALLYLRREEIIGADFKPLHWLIPFSTLNSGEVWDFPYGSPPQNLFIIEGLMRTHQEKAEDLAVELTKALVKTIYVGYLTRNTLYKQESEKPISFYIRIATKVVAAKRLKLASMRGFQQIFESNSIFKKKYSAVDLGLGVNERIAPKVSQAGYAWTNGAVLSMFEWFGYLLQPSDYKGFTPSQKHLVSIESKMIKRKRGKATESYDDEFKQPSNVVGPSQQPTRQLRKKSLKLSNYEESEPSLAEDSSINRDFKGKGVRSSNRNKKQFSYAPSSSEESIRKELQRQTSKLSNQSEPPPTEATTEPSPRVRRSRRIAKNADAEKSEPPSNETAQSEQPRRKRVVRKASKQFLEELEPFPDETVPGAQTSRKRRRRKFGKLSSYEESEPPSNEVPQAEPPSNEVPQAEPPKNGNSKKRKSSKPKRTF